MNSLPDKQKILIVDDSPENIRVLMECLGNEYATIAATDGSSALDMAHNDPSPDIILLDIMMPGMDGCEVCLRLKSTSQLRDIPVIFLSALESTEIKVKAFKSGGVDYITKPFQAEEVQARVKTHLMIRKLQLRLEHQNLLLEQTVSERTGELKTAYERLLTIDRIKSDFLKMISHEMRTPLNGILGVSELVFDLCPSSDQKGEYWQYYLEGRERMEQLLEDSLLLNSLGSSSRNLQCASVIFMNVFGEALRSINNISVTLEESQELSNTIINSDFGLLKRALIIIIRLAACFNAAQNRISLKASLNNGLITLEIPLNSFRLSETQALEFFELTSNIRGQSHAESMGLAPVVAERIITLLGGTVRLLKTANDSGLLSLTLTVRN
jgi:CheY-like chemotaxis protein